MISMTFDFMLSVHAGFKCFPKPSSLYSNSTCFQRAFRITSITKAFPNVNRERCLHFCSIILRPWSDVAEGGYVPVEMFNRKTISAPARQNLLNCFFSNRDSQPLLPGCNLGPSKSPLHFAEGSGRRHCFRLNIFTGVLPCANQTTVAR